MSIILACPTLASPTAQVILPDVEKLPRSRPVRGRQNVFTTDAEVDVVYDFGGNTEVFSMQLGPLSSTDAAAVKAFFTNPAPTGVNKRALAWQLQDSDGITYNVTFAQDVMEPQEIGVSWHNVSLTMKVVA
ncbi:hypothetical protein [Mariprofundus ferrooxydans]|uniref:hypothetical protein n=1 Tax=Mariprofundus ferrooxydans TaxID=314344 RepID=UPI00142F850A|nr:hypothetical protein [Mariprofundus ferrooxydans]